MKTKKAYKNFICIFIISAVVFTGCGNGNPVKKHSLKNDIIATEKNVKEFLEPEEDPDFSGKWKDVVSGNCVAEISSAGEDVYDIVIERNNDDLTVSVWKFKGTYYQSTTLMEYENAEYHIRNGEEEELIYDDGYGYFSMEPHNEIEWTGGNSDIDGIETLLMEKAK